MLDILIKNKIDHKIILTKSDKINSAEISNILQSQKERFLLVDAFSIKNECQIFKIANEISELLSN